MFLPTTVVGYWLRAPQDKFAVLKDAAHDIYALQKEGGVFDSDVGMVWEEDLLDSNSSAYWMSAREGSLPVLTSRQCLLWFPGRTHVDCFVYAPLNSINKSIIERWQNFMRIREGKMNFNFQRPEMDLRKLAYSVIKQDNLLAIHFIKTEHSLTTMVGYSVFRCKQLAPSLRLEGFLREQLEPYEGLDDERRRLERPDCYEMCDCYIKLEEWDCTIRPTWLEIESDQFGGGANFYHHLLYKASRFSELFLEKFSVAGIIP